MQPYNQAEVQKILHIRCEEEDVEMSGAAAALLTRIGSYTNGCKVYISGRSTHGQSMLLVRVL